MNQLLLIFIKLLLDFVHLFLKFIIYYLEIVKCLITLFYRLGL